MFWTNLDLSYKFPAKLEKALFDSQDQIANNGTQNLAKKPWNSTLLGFRIVFFPFYLKNRNGSSIRTNYLPNEVEDKSWAKILLIKVYTERKWKTNFLHGETFKSPKISPFHCSSKFQFTIITSPRDIQLRGVT